MKNLTELQLKELLDLVDTGACELDGEHSAKKEILRRFEELEQRTQKAEQQLRDQSFIAARPSEELRFKSV
ncbi:MAG: hypothetical protein WC673_00110 [Candidatus Paceibacterota bacterium]|jgi:hypothetical protein